MIKNRPGRRSQLVLAIIAIVIATAVYLLVQRNPSPGSASAVEMIVHKHPQCGCCVLWMDHLKAAGFQVSARSQPDAVQRWQRHGVPRELGACHTAEVDGYIIEGHVPADDIRRLLTERPDAVGLILPGMPLGSPGMEGPNPEPYDVLLLKRDGTTEVFQRHTPHFGTEKHSGNGVRLTLCIY